MKECLWTVRINDSVDYNTVEYVVLATSCNGAMIIAISKLAVQSPGTRIDIVTIKRVKGNIVQTGY